MAAEKSDPKYVLALAQRATSAYGRSDLGERLDYSARRLTAPDIKVLVAGEFNQGKSQLVNALVNAPICPADAEIATSVPTMVCHSLQPRAVLVPQDGESVPIPLEKLAQHVCEDRNPGNRAGWRYALVGVPRDILAGGLKLVDTPGAGGLGSAAGATTAAALPWADALLFVSDAGAEYTATEIDFLRRANSVCPNVLCVVTKIDRYPQWRRIVEINRGHLDRAGIDTDILAVSAMLRLHAAATGDAELNAESGVSPLVRWLRDQVVNNYESLQRRAVVNDVLRTTDELRTMLSSELAAHRDPSRNAEVLAELRAAKERMSRLREQSARWQQTLSDGMTDLISDVEHDLRDRLRQIIRDSEAELDANDPALIEADFTEWMRKRLTVAASTTFDWAGERARFLAGQVAEHFAEEQGQALPRLELGGATTIDRFAEEFALPRVEKFKFGEKMLTGVRGGYGGMLMVGLLATVVGMSLINPVSVVAGVALGGKTIREEKKRQLERRRVEAKAAVRKQIDEIVFTTGKECKDMLREVQRTLRNHFTDHAESTLKTLTEAVKAAEKAGQTAESEHQRRVGDLEAELKRLDALENLAAGLTALPAGTGQ